MIAAKASVRRARVWAVRAFTLVELIIVVAIVGVLATLSSYGFRKHIAAAKSAEAVTAIGGIATAVRIAAERETMAGVVLALGTHSTSVGSSDKVTGSTSGKGKGNGNGGAAVTHDPVTPGLCGSSEPVPRSLDSVKGRKYQPSPSDYASGDAQTGWRCLLFSNELPQYYQVQYRAGNGAPVSVELPHGGTPPGLSQDRSWTASARGDLDGDGETSWFVLNGSIDLDGRIRTAPAIASDRPDE